MKQHFSNQIVGSESRKVMQVPHVCYLPNHLTVVLLVLSAASAPCSTSPCLLGGVEDVAGTRLDCRGPIALAALLSAPKLLHHRGHLQPRQGALRRAVTKNKMDLNN